MIGGITDENVVRTIRSAQHYDVNALYAYITTLDNLSVKDDKNKVASVSGFKNDRKDRLSNRSNPSIINDESAKSTGDKISANNNYAIPRML